MRQVENVSVYRRPVLSFEGTVRRVRDDIRWMDDEDAGERDDNRGGRH